MKSILIGTLAAMLAAGAQSNEAERQLKAAVNAELVNGDLKTAIKQYGEISAKYKNDRAVAAMALVRMADAYQKIGSAEWRNIYERVLREYADQKEAVAVARLRLGRDGSTGREGGIATRQVWAPAMDTEGSPSPDGLRLSFVDWKTGDLAIRDLKTGENRRVTNKGSWAGSEDFALYSTFSPDGTQLAYAWFSANNTDTRWDLRIISANIGAEPAIPRVLYRNTDLDYIQPAQWSEDGKNILALFRKKDRTHQIAIVSVKDGTARILKTLDWRSPLKLSLSPDGRYIAYDFPPNEKSEARDIVVLAADGSREIVLVSHPANDATPVWTPDGSGILFTSDRSGSNGAWLIPVADGKASGPAKFIKPDIGQMVPMAFTRAGTLFYALMTANTAIYTGRLDLKAKKLLEPMKALSEDFTGSHVSPDWSPRGDKLAFITRRFLGSSPTTFFLTIRSLNTGEERRLTPDLEYINAIRWSHDGETLVTSGRDRRGRAGIYQVDANTGQTTAIVATGEDFRNPLVSQDGKLLYYHTTPSGQNISHGRAVVLDRETGAERELLAAGRLAINCWALSRDGGRLALLTSNYENKSMAIYVMTASGDEPRMVLELKDFGPQVLEWEPDGNGVMFARQGQGHGALACKEGNQRSWI